MKSKYQCPYCQYTSSRKWNLKNHVRNVHRIKDFPNGENEKMKCKYKCPHCQYMSSKKWNMERHIKNVHEVKNFSNGSNEKPNTNQHNIRPTEFYTESDCSNHKSWELLQKIGAEIALLLLKEYIK